MRTIGALITGLGFLINLSGCFAGLGGVIAAVSSSGGGSSPRAPSTPVVNPRNEPDARTDLDAVLVTFELVNKSALVTFEVWERKQGLDQRLGIATIRSSPEGPCEPGENLGPFEVKTLQSVYWCAADDLPTKDYRSGEIFLTCKPEGGSTTPIGPFNVGNDPPKVNQVNLIPPSGGSTFGTTIHVECELLDEAGDDVEFYRMWFSTDITGCGRVDVEDPKLIEIPGPRSTPSPARAPIDPWPLPVSLPQEEPLAIKFSWDALNSLGRGTFENVRFHILVKDSMYDYNCWTFFSSCAHAVNTQKPFIAAIDPGSGPLLAQNDVTITGENFQEPTAVFFVQGALEEVEATTQFISDKRLQVTWTPGLDARVGLVDVRLVTNYESVTVPAQYEYRVPEITDIDPPYGLLRGNTLVSVHGISFDAPIGSTQAVIDDGQIRTGFTGVVVIDDENLRGVTPKASSEAGPVAVEVTNYYGTAYKPHAFFYGYNEGEWPETVDWVVQAGVAGGPRMAGHDVAVLSDGSAFVAGSRGDDIFLARYNPGGSRLWLNVAGGQAVDRAEGVAVLFNGSAYVTGSFEGTATFGSTIANKVELTSAGDSDIFLARYNPDGTLAWARRAGGPSSDSAMGVALLADGSALVAGYFFREAVFGANEPNETAFLSAGGDDPLYGSHDVFAARYNPDGSLAWATRAGGIWSDMAHSITTLPDGSLFVAGEFRNEAIFGAMEPGDAETRLTSTGLADIFLARYNSDGTLAWAKQAGRGGKWDTAAAHSVAAMSDGSAFMTGQFSGEAVFGGTEAATRQVRLWSGGDTDMFLACYNHDGTLAWAKQAGGPDRDEAYDVAVLPGGWSVVTGMFVDRGLFGSEDANRTERYSLYLSRDVFIALYSPTGRLAWAKQAGSGEDNDSGNGVAVLGDGTIFVTGEFSGTTSDPGHFDQLGRASLGESDCFLARYRP